MWIVQWSPAAQFSAKEKRVKSQLKELDLAQQHSNILTEHFSQLKDYR